MSSSRQEPQQAQHEGRDEAMAVAKRLASLPESTMRGAMLLEQLAGMGAARAVWTLEWLLRGALVRDSHCLTVYESLLDPGRCAEAMGSERVSELTDAGLQQGCVAALQWLSTLVVEPAPPCAAGDAERLVHWQLRELTLGDRRAQARRARGDAANRFVCDPDPGVITNLLNNPRTTEQRVLSICSRRPTLSAPLEAVLRATRWSSRYRVKVALARNPYLALRYGVSLLVCLTRSDREQVRDDATLAPALRLAAQRLLSLDADGAGA